MATSALLGMENMRTGSESVGLSEYDVCLHYTQTDLVAHIYSMMLGECGIEFKDHHKL